MEDGVFSATEEGAPQGGLVSPVLSHIYLHYVLDLWFEKRYAKGCGGKAYLIRYADDYVACFEQEADARRFQTEMEQRLAQFDLQVERSQELARLVSQRRHAHREGEARFRGEAPQGADLAGKLGARSRAKAWDASSRIIGPTQASSGAKCACPCQRWMTSAYFWPMPGRELQVVDVKEPVSPPADQGIERPGMTIEPFHGDGDRQLREAARGPPGAERSRGSPAPYGQVELFEQPTLGSRNAYPMGPPADINPNQNLRVCMAVTPSVRRVLRAIIQRLVYAQSHVRRLAPSRQMRWMMPMTGAAFQCRAALRSTPPTPRATPRQRVMLPL
jgi:reverse transcriptase-like protein